MPRFLSSVAQLAVAAKGLFRELERSAAPVTPLTFLMTLRERFPQFAQTSPQTGTFMQQDAEECWSQLMYALRERLQVRPSKQLRFFLNCAARVAQRAALFFFKTSVFFSVALHERLWV
jgi:Ubiquitin carboxyl-terminal hydrolase